MRAAGQRSGPFFRYLANLQQAVLAISFLMCLTIFICPAEPVHSRDINYSTARHALMDKPDIDGEMAIAVAADKFARPIERIYQKIAGRGG